MSTKSAEQNGDKHEGDPEGQPLQSKETCEANTHGNSGLLSKVLAKTCTIHHGKTITSYCRNHSSVLCIQCLLHEHKHCIENVEAIEQIIEETKTLSTVVDGTFDRLSSHILTGHYRKSKVFKRLANLESCLLSGIEQMRLNLTDQVNAKASEAVDVIKSVLGDKKDAVSGDLKFLTMLQDRLTSVTSFVQEKEDISKIMKVIDTLSAVEKEYTDRHIKNQDVKCHFYVSPEIQRIKKKFTSFGELCLEEKVLERNTLYFSPSLHNLAGCSDICSGEMDRNDVSDTCKDYWQNDDLFIEVPVDTMRCNSSQSGRYTSIDSEHRYPSLHPPEIPSISERPPLKLSKKRTKFLEKNSKINECSEKEAENNLEKGSRPETKLIQETQVCELIAGELNNQLPKEVLDESRQPIPPIPVRKSTAVKSEGVSLSKSTKEESKEMANKPGKNIEGKEGHALFSMSPFYTPPDQEHADFLPLKRVSSDKTTLRSQYHVSTLKELHAKRISNSFNKVYIDSGIADSNSCGTQRQSPGPCHMLNEPHNSDDDVAAYCVNSLFPIKTYGPDGRDFEEFLGKLSSSRVDEDTAHDRGESDTSFDSRTNPKEPDSSFQKGMLRPEYIRRISRSDSNLATCTKNDVLVDCLVSASSQIEVRNTQNKGRFLQHRKFQFYEAPSESSFDFHGSSQMSCVSSKPDSSSQKTDADIHKQGFVDIYVNFSRHKRPVVTGVALVANENVVLCDNENDLVMLTSEFGNIIDLYGISKPFGCVWMQDDRVAVTSTTRRSVCILYMTNDKLYFQREVSIGLDSGTTFGICFTNGIFCVSCSSSVKVLTDDLQELKTLVSYTFSKTSRWLLSTKPAQLKPLFVDVRHVACEWTDRRQYVYVTDVIKERIICLDMIGGVKWVQQLISPQSVSFLGGELFVACRKEVTVIEACSGLFLREIKINHIKHPICHVIDERRERLYVPVSTSKCFIKITVCSLLKQLQ